MIQEYGYDPGLLRSGAPVVGATANRLVLVGATGLVDVTNTKYESGTWTPALTFATPGDLSVVHSVQDGEYRIVGDLVQADFRVTVTTWTHTSASGNFRIGGFPFSFRTPSSAANLRFGIVPWSDNFVLTGYVDAHLQGVAGQVYANILVRPLTGNIAIAGTAQCPTGAALQLRGSITYRT